MVGKRIVALSLLALVVLTLGLFASSGAEAGTYKPTNLYQITTNTAGAASDTTTTVTIPSPDYNYEDSSMYNFAPIAGLPAPGEQFAIGTYMGNLSSSTTLGLLNSACNQSIGPAFNLYNASLNTSVQATPLETAWTNTGRLVPYRYKCGNNTDDDADTKVNDGCPASGAPEATCNEAACPDTDGYANQNGLPYWDFGACDDDADGYINDGCPKLAKDDDTTDTAETTAGRRVNDGCPVVSPVSEKGLWCGGSGTGDNVDQDGDTTLDDGCGSIPVVGPISEAGDHCANDIDDDGDTTVNDGCDMVGTIAETGAQCIDSEVSSDINLPDYLEFYPHFLNLMLDPDGPSGNKPPLQPRARYAGDNLVSTSNMLIEVVILSPGQIAQLPGIKAQMVPGLGYAVLTVLNNPVDQQENPGAVSDFCTYLQSISILYGTAKDNLTTGTVNDGCPAAGPGSTPETTCNEASCPDIDGTSPWDTCDDDGDTKINDGCGQVGATAETVGPPNQCGNNLNDDGDPPNEGGLTSQTNPANNSGILATNTHLNRTYNQSERDFDADGYENDMDPCPYISDPLWDPRAACAGAPLTKPGDTDCDGLPDTCDPDPGPGLPGCGGTCPSPCPACKNSDQDGDGYNNQQDICPLVADGPAPGQNQIDSDGLVTNADLGPQPDSIGNACDDSDNDGKEDGSTVAPGAAGTGNCRDGIDNDGVGGADMLDADCLVWTDKGEIAALPARTQVQIYGTNPGTGLYWHQMPWAPVCVGAGLDTDLDGYCDLTEDALGSDDTDITEKPESYVIDFSISGVGPNVSPAATAPQSCSDGVDNDKDGATDAADAGCTSCPIGTDPDCDGVLTAGPPNDNCSAVWNPEQTNTDGDALGDVCDPDDDADGSNDVNESWQGTDPLDNCTNGSGSLKSDAWPLDQNKDKKVMVVGDVNFYAGKIGQTVYGSPPTSWVYRRLDMNMDGKIMVVGDVNAYSGKIGNSCT
jgi:hypothetical protein